MKFKGLCAISALVACAAAGGLHAQVYSEKFFNRDLPVEQCDAWSAFVAKLVEQDYTLITISGSEDPDGISCDDPDVVKSIAKALNEGNKAPVNHGKCGGHTWWTGGCGPLVELTATGSICTCQTPGYTLRVCLRGRNWGGVNTATCNGPDQTMTVIFVAGGNKCEYEIKKSKGKKGCKACPSKGDVFVSEQTCEEKKDCRKSVKAKIDCQEGEKGFCKIRAKRRSCP